MNAQIAKDESLLRAQESSVNKAESLLLSRVNALDKAEALRSRAGSSNVPRVRISAARKVQGLMASPPDGGDPRPLAAPWKETVPDHSHVYLQTSLSAPDESDVVDSEKIADWNRFFDGFTKRVDAPKWDVKDIISDNLDNITPCNIDCDKNGLVRCALADRPRDTKQRRSLCNGLFVSRGRRSTVPEPVLRAPPDENACRRAARGGWGGWGGGLGGVQTTLSDFAFFNNLTRTETDAAGRVHIVDSLDGIDACTIDC